MSNVDNEYGFRPAVAERPQDEHTEDPDRDDREVTPGAVYEHENDGVTENEDEDEDEVEGAQGMHPAETTDVDEPAEVNETTDADDAADVDEAAHADETAHMDETADTDETGDPATDPYAEQPPVTADSAGEPAADPYLSADPSVTGSFPPVREAQEAPVVQEAPVAQEVPVVQEAPVAQEAPVVHEVPVAEPDAQLAAVPSAGADHFARMQEIQLAFIDDPRQAALDAENLLADVLQSFTEELTRQRDALQSSPADGAPDTERMRLAVRRSRQLIDALANLG